MKDRFELTQDRQLVEAVLSGDPAARRVFAERMRCVPRILAFRNRKLGAPFRVHELEDMAQEVMVGILGRLDSFEGRSSLETWAGGFCFHELSNQLRTRQRRGGTMRPQVEEPVAAEADEPESPPRLMDCLDRLPHREAEVVRLRFVEALGFPQIGNVLGISPSTAKTHCYRALTKLRRMLQPAEESSR